eukprot:CAMPEP_0170188598 /NCGR_PEP_ID=MMETSP0040_2-20121228/44714_1 /TAXON_ID=641309 /ORGANISM="Lotharella oceanica, Strain CCMP622" /LENGTH=69 /DNA_ID=CAMNT_0010435925 /DNA_START=102 /DNA_END=311 /DNA_ORIENTATION=+
MEESPSKPDLLAMASAKDILATIYGDHPTSRSDSLLSYAGEVIVKMAQGYTANQIRAFKEELKEEIENR